MLMPSLIGERLFDDLFDFAVPRTHTTNAMRTDIRETEQGYELDVDLPGYKKDDQRREKQRQRGKRGPVCPQRTFLWRHEPQLLRRRQYHAGGYPGEVSGRYPEIVSAEG